LNIFRLTYFIFLKNNLQRQNKKEAFMYQWLVQNRPLLRVLFVFFLFLAAAAWLPPDLPPALTADEPAVKLTLPLLRLPALQVNLLFSDNPEWQKDALDITKKDLVKYLRPESEAEKWEMQVLKMSLGDRERQWLVAALSHPGEEGILCILVPQDKQYTLFYTQEDLASIISMQNLTQIDNVTGEKNELLLITEKMKNYKGDIRNSLWQWQKDRLQLVALPHE